MTGSAEMDFEGDGAAEVVYSDEESLGFMMERQKMSSNGPDMILEPDTSTPLELSTSIRMIPLKSCCLEADAEYG